MSPPEAAVLLFTATNAVRLVAYLPQILTVARDRNGAAAVSGLTWGLFAVSNASTLLYALLVLDDRRMAAVFAANTACCVAILALTVVKRVGFRSRLYGRAPIRQN